MTDEIKVNEEEQTEVNEPIVEETPPIAVEEKVPEPIATNDAEIEERIKKAAQSASSKAKNEILKEIGIESVADIKAQIEKGSKLDEVTKGLADLNTELEAIKAEREALKNKSKDLEDKLLLKELEVSDDFSKEFIKLVDLDDSGADRLEVAKKLKAKFLSGNVFGNVVNKIGSDKTPPPEEKTLKDKFKDLQKL